jgi:hypothetical protein
MNRKLFGWSVVVLLACCSVCAAQESAWMNERGSTLYIEDVDSEGRIAGFYINRASGFNCIGTPYPVTGWVLEGTNTVTFTVKWENTVENCQSLTSWTGFFSSDGQTMTTLWQLVPNGATNPSQILTGSDSFTRVALKKLDSLMQKQ